MIVRPLLISSAFLTGCATLSQTECQSANWQSIGYQDGASGQPSTYLKNHIKACAKHSIYPDFSLWEIGRTQGLVHYCLPVKAYTLGQSGQSISPVCPTESLSRLNRANSEGKKYFQIKRTLKKNKALLGQHKKQFQKLLNSPVNTGDIKFQVAYKQREIIELEQKIEKFEVQLQQFKPEF